MKVKTLIYRQDSFHESELPRIVTAHILPTIENNISNVWLLQGDLGAGKTRTVQAILNAVGISDVNSPTFSIINEYESSIVGHIYHMDFYRIKNTEEAIGTGVEEILYSDKLCFIEWPDVILAIMPENYYLIELNHSESGLERGISIFLISEE